MENVITEPRLIWDKTLAEKLAGKLLLVGLNSVDRDGALLTQQQLFGRVVRTMQDSGIVLKLEGHRAGDEYILPPDMRSIVVARHGDYHLRSTGEVVSNPDYTVTFALHRQDENQDEGKDEDRLPKVADVAQSATDSK